MHLSEAEWKVMSCVWDRGAVGARDVCDALRDERGWAYTTVKTMMARLAQKGALTERKERNASVYEAAVSRSKCRRAALRSLVDGAFGGAVEPMVHFLVGETSFSAEAADELTRLLEEKRRKKARR